MLLPLLFLSLAAAETPPLPDGGKMDWVELPTASALEQCWRENAPRVGAATFKLECISAEGDRVKNCKVVETSTKDHGAKRAMICSSKQFRIRTTDAAGNVITGVTVKVPFHKGAGTTPRP